MLENAADDCKSLRLLRAHAGPRFEYARFARWIGWGGRRLQLPTPDLVPFLGRISAVEIGSQEVLDGESTRDKADSKFAYHTQAGRARLQRAKVRSRSRPAFFQPT